MALTPDQIFILEIFEFGFATLALGLMIIFYIIRIIKSYKSTGQINWVRVILLLVFSVDFIFNGLFEFIALFTSNPITDVLYVEFNGDLPLSAWDTGTIVMFGTMLAIYINKKDSFLFFPVFLQIGAIALYYFTGLYVFEEIYTYLFAVIALISLFEVGIRIKENNALGLAIMYTVQFITVIGISFVVDSALSSIASFFGVFLAAGIFHPFGKEED